MVQISLIYDEVSMAEKLMAYIVDLTQNTVYFPSYFVVRRSLKNRDNCKIAKCLNLAQFVGKCKKQ